MSERSHQIRIAVFTVLALTGLAVYRVGLRGAYYADDFKLVFPYPSEKIFYFFFHANPNSSFYRPMEWMVAATIQSLAGMNTFPIHMIILLCHVVLSFLVYYAALELTRSHSIAWLSSGYMLLSQANAMAVLGNDMLSQVAGTLFGFASLWYFYRLYSAKEKPIKSARKYFLSLFCFTTALLFKETSVSFVAALTVIAILGMPDKSGRTIRRSVRNLSPFYLVTIIYVIIHFVVVARQGADRYQLCVGTNFLTNLAFSIFSAFLPVSSVTTFIAYSQHHFALLFLILAATLVVFSGVAMGLHKHGLTPGVRSLAAVALANLFPMVLFRHMGELYVYNSMPAVAILFGIGARWFYDGYLRIQPARACGMILMIALLLSHGYADYTKGELGVLNGSRATELIKGIQPFISKIPHDGTLVLLNPRIQTPQYSVFLMNGFNVLIYGTNILNQISNRYDFQVWIVDGESDESKLFPPNALMLEFEGDHVQMMGR